MAGKQTAVVPVTTQIKSILDGENVKRRFAEVLGEKAPQFTASIANVVASSQKLQDCDANSIIGAAFVAATYDLPIDSNLGFAAIVPYRSKDSMQAQFQMMYKGFIQLAIRSGQYEKMNCSIVYKDEIKSYNPITGELEFVTDFESCTDRDSGDDTKIAGYYARFKLKSGFVHELFMTKKDVINHATKYSQAYAYDVKYNKKASLWSNDFNTMALKTVIKMLLSKWGILSIDMQRAIKDDQKIYDENGNGSYGDNQGVIVADITDEVRDPLAVDNKAVNDTQKEDTPDNKGVAGEATADSTAQTLPEGEPPSMFDEAEQIDITSLA